MLVRLSKWQLFKKRFLLVLSWLFIYLFPIVLIVEKTVKIKDVKNYVSVSAVGMMVGLAFTVFAVKRIRKALEKLKKSAITILISWLTAIVPIATVGALIYLVEMALKGGYNIAFYICASILVGALMQAVDFAINKKLIYRLELQDEAKREVDKKHMMKEYEKELEDDA